MVIEEEIPLSTSSPIMRTDDSSRVFLGEVIYSLLIASPSESASFQYSYIFNGL